MKRTQEIFLYILRHALSSEKEMPLIEITDAEWRQIFRIADIHRVFPMIFEISWKNTDLKKRKTGYYEKARKKAVDLTCDQGMMTAEFLKLYKYLGRKGLSPVVMKGIICRRLYPNPEQRSSSDEDLLIPKERFAEYHQAFLDYGLHVVNEDIDINETHEVSYCNSRIYIELHKNPFPESSQAYGSLNHYFEDSENRKISEKIYGVPVWTMEYTDHLFYQICHAYKHFLYSGIGIRLISDIVLYSIVYHSKIDWDLICSRSREIQAFDFVRALYRIGEKYLFPDTFPPQLNALWETEKADESALLEDILDGGIFGTSSEDRLHAANITLNTTAANKSGKKSNAVLNSLFPSFSYMKSRYPYLARFPVLLPAAWLHRIFSYVFRRDRNNMYEAVRIGNERVQLMHKYRMLEEEKDKGHVSWLKKIYKKSYKSAAAPVFSVLFRMISWLEYHILNCIWFLKGSRSPDDEEIKLVKDNVTFFVKSFERQKLVKELCKNISHMYPGVNIIIADDSRKPLEVNLANVKVIQLPFNSGLSAGLAAALNEVETPYVVRMDDDELLTLRSNVHRELKYLIEHPEIDLIGFGFTTAVRCRNARNSFKDYYSQPMDDAPKPLKIPHMTVLDDNHIVLGKTANIYIAKTDVIKKIGYDPNIKVIDHHEFFWRAAGIMVSAGALDTVIFHRHNPYDRHYNSYRSDYKDDLEYIRKKRKQIIMEGKK